MSALERPETGKAEDASPHTESLPRVGFGFAQVNPTRSLILLAAGAVIGLGIAGFGLFNAKGTTSNAVPPEDVALVNNKPVLVSDFVAQVEAENGIPFAQTSRAEKLKVLNEMIREELFVQRGLELDEPSSDPDTRSALVAAVEQQVAANVTAQQPTDQQMHDYFNAHRAKYATDGTMTVNELIVPGTDAAAGARAREAVQALRGGASPEAVGAQFGAKDSGRMDDGEEFYFAAKIHIGEPLFNVARVLSTGQVSDPQAAADGFHILIMERNNKPVPMSFEDSRQQVLFDFKKEEQDKLEKGNEQFLRNKSDILIAKEYR